MDSQKYFVMTVVARAGLIFYEILFCINRVYTWRAKNIYIFPTLASQTAYMYLHNPWW